MEFKMGNRTFTLDNDFVVLYEDGLDGGGIDHLPDFINAINSNGKIQYENAVEWCAGFGVIGFRLLNSNISTHMSFADSHEIAINWLIKTSEHNKVNDRTSFYLSDKISLIPNDVKWDLVVANPPHSFDRGTVEHFEKTLSGQQKNDVIRITCDEGFRIHKEFFENIRARLLPGADIFMSEVCEFEAIEKMALDAGLQVVTRYPAPKLSINSQTDAVVFHFKEPV
jgi:methylase of polypeptide subunit release factors